MSTGLSGSSFSVISGTQRLCVDLRSRNSSTTLPLKGTSPPTEVSAFMLPFHSNWRRTIVFNTCNRRSCEAFDVLQNDHSRNATLGCNGNITVKRRSNHVQRCEDKILYEGNDDERIQCHDDIDQGGAQSFRQPQPGELIVWLLQNY